MKEIDKIISSLTEKLDFKKSNFNWILKDENITKIINLQKSKFSNLYYVNYGFNINQIETKDIKIQIATSFTDESFNLENQLSKEEREIKIRFIIKKIIVDEFNKVTTIDDLKNLLLKRKHLNDIPLVLKQFLNINSK